MKVLRAGPIRDDEFGRRQHPKKLLPKVITRAMADQRLSNPR